jgi:membrane-associated phospholipid phosphatase
MSDFGENNIIENFIYHLGVSGPYIIFIYALYILRNKNNYLSIYCIGFVINIIINLLLKAIIRQPRPSYNKPEINIIDALGKYPPFNVYGMPSGHAQLTAFTFFYLFLVTKNIQTVLITLLLIIITGYQRVLSMKHTILQVFVGTILGLLFGYFFYRYAQYLIKNRV